VEGRLSSAGRKRRQLNISREAENWMAGGRTGRGVLRAVIYEVSKTLYTPPRQRAGLAPRNPVLALTHRYLSHDHFRPIRAHAHGETYVRLHGLLCLLHAGVFTIYSAPRVGNAVGYLVDIVYLGYSPPHDRRDFSSRRQRLSLACRLVAIREEASTKRLLSAGPPRSWETNGPVAHIGIRSAPAYTRNSCRLPPRDNAGPNCIVIALLKHL